MKHQKFKEATKDMTPQKKWEYIWMYYKLPIISTICVLVLGAYSIYEFQTRQTTVLNVVLTSGNRLTPNVEALRQSLNESLAPTEGRYTVTIMSHNFSVAENARVSPEETQAIMTLLAVGELDILLLDEPTFWHFYEIGGLIPLTGFGLDLDPSDVVYADNQPFGLRAEAFSVLDDVAEGGTFIVAAGAGSQRHEMVKSFLGLARQ